MGGGQGDEVSVQGGVDTSDGSDDGIRGGGGSNEGARVRLGKPGVGQQEDMVGESRGWAGSSSVYDVGTDE